MKFALRLIMQHLYSPIVRDGLLDSGGMDDSTKGPDKTSTFRELFFNPASYKPFALLMILFILMQSTGTFAIIFYAVNVFQGK